MSPKKITRVLAYGSHEAFELLETVLWIKQLAKISKNMEVIKDQNHVIETFTFICMIG
jgi:hypothetical protein